MVSGLHTGKGLQMSKKSNRYKRLLRIEKSKDPNQIALDRLSQMITGRRGVKLIVRIPDGGKMEFGQTVLRNVDVGVCCLEFEAFYAVATGEKV